mgnify:CR=1 FL=1
MLEIVMLIFMAKSIGRIAEKKGRRGGGYKALLVLLWFGGEIAGIVAGVLLMPGEEPVWPYGCGILGAILGTLAAFSIAGSLKPLSPQAPRPA